MTTQKIPAAFACIECESATAASDHDGCCTTCGGDLIVLSGLPAEREHVLKQIVNVVQCRERTAVDLERASCAQLASDDALKNDNEADKLPDHLYPQANAEHQAARDALYAVADAIRARDHDDRI